MSKIRALIVDDEPIARRGIRLQLKRVPDVEIVGECGNGIEAVAAIQQLTPNLVFLDVQMPEVDGFEVIEAIGVAQMPQVIFVTAYDQYAVRAFEVHALDYLLKPFDRQRFVKALDHARSSLAQSPPNDFGRQLMALFKDHLPPRTLERVVIKSGGRIYFLNVDEIEWIKSADNYVELHVGRDVHLLRETITGLAAKLDPDRFVRIRHSALVNVGFIKELRPFFRGEYLVILRGGTELRSSQRYRKNLEGVLGN